MYAVQLGVKRFGRDKSLQKDLMGLLDLVDAVGQPSIIHHLGPVVASVHSLVHRFKIVWPNYDAGFAKCTAHRRKHDSRRLDSMSSSRTWKEPT